MKLTQAMRNLDLGQEFELLANQKHWPCPGHSGVKDLEFCHGHCFYTRAQLALMVVEKERLAISYRLGSSKQIETMGVLRAYNINKIHYTNVKARVEAT